MFGTNAQLQEALDKTPSDAKVTKEMMQQRIVKVEYFVLPDTTCTICNISLDNGFSVRGESACVDPRNYHKDIGESIAYDRAFASLWPLFGFLLAEEMHWMRTQEREAGMLAALGNHDGE